MINNLLALINEEGNLGLGEACLYALIGYVIVFVGIAIIILIIWLIGLILRKTNNLSFLSKKTKKRNEIVQPLQQQIEEVKSDDIPDEVKAAIVAALMAYYTEEKPQCEFRVRRIKRI